MADVKQFIDTFANVSTIPIGEVVHSMDTPFGPLAYRNASVGQDCVHDGRGLVPASLSTWTNWRTGIDYRVGQVLLDFGVQGAHTGSYVSDFTVPAATPFGFSMALTTEVQLGVTTGTIQLVAGKGLWTGDYCSLYVFGANSDPEYLILGIETATDWREVETPPIEHLTTVQLSVEGTTVNIYADGALLLTEEVPEINSVQADWGMFNAFAQYKSPLEEPDTYEGIHSIGLGGPGVIGEEGLVRSRLTKNLPPPPPPPPKSEWSPPPSTNTTPTQPPTHVCVPDHAAIVEWHKVLHRHSPDRHPTPDIPIGRIHTGVDGWLWEYKGGTTWNLTRYVWEQDSRNPGPMISECGVLGRYK